VNFGVNHEYMKLDDRFQSNYGDLNVLMIWPYSRVSMTMHRLNGFLNQICSFELTR